MESYSVRCFFLWESRPEQQAAHLYEERITLWSAESMEAAGLLAEQEARVYATENGVEALDYWQAYALVKPISASGVEIFSLLRESDLEPMEYLDAFFDTGSERQ